MTVDATPGAVSRIVLAPKEGVASMRSRTPIRPLQSLPILLLTALVWCGFGTASVHAQDCATLRIGGVCPGPVQIVAQSITPGADTIFPTSYIT